MAQRQIQLRAPAQPGAGTIAGIAGDVENAGQDIKDTTQSDLITPGQRPLRIVEAQHHGGVDIRRRRDTLLRDIAGDVDDEGDDPTPGDELATVPQNNERQLSVYHDTNILIVLDLRAVPAGRADHHGRLFQSHIETAQATLANLLHAYGMIGAVQATVVAFARGATLHFPWGQAPAALASLKSLRAEHVANGANPIAKAHDAWTAGGRIAENAGNIVYFLSYGDASAEGGAVDHLPEDDKRQWNNFLHGSTLHFDRVFSVGFNHPAIVM